MSPQKGWWLKVVNGLLTYQISKIKNFVNYLKSACKSQIWNWQGVYQSIRLLLRNKCIIPSLTFADLNFLQKGWPVKWRKPDLWSWYLNAVLQTLISSCEIETTKNKMSRMNLRTRLFQFTIWTRAVYFLCASNGTVLNSTSTRTHQCSSPI